MLFSHWSALTLLLLVLWAWDGENGADAAAHKINHNSPQLRRIMAEWKEIQAAGLGMTGSNIGEGTELVRLMPSPKSMFDWHFTFAGPPGSTYAGGLYHGRIILPPDYPNSAPSVRLLTPSGRFVPGARICLSASEFHPESWSPSWTMRTLVVALRMHMLTSPGEIGSCRSPPSARRRYARESRRYKCSTCGCRHRDFPADIFPQPAEATGAEAAEEEAARLIRRRKGLTRSGSRGKGLKRAGRSNKAVVGFVFAMVASVVLSLLHRGIGGLFGPSWLNKPM
ncbi:unnamed protein product [Chrysoparadoxa australica]